jgi:hypothetical protein
MKKLLLILNFSFLIFNSSFAQAPAWTWANSAGGIYNDYIGSVATDAGANVLVTGYFYSPSITFGTTVLTNANASGSTTDMFVVKYDGAGNVLWAHSAGGTGDEGGSGVATDAGGNVLVTGWFYSPSITFGTTVLTNAGGSDVFVAKLDNITGIAEENYSVETIYISPNPAFNELTVSSGQEAVKEIEIYSVLGEKVFSQQQTTNNKQQATNNKLST